MYQLMQTRTRLVEEMRGIIQNPEGATGDLSEAQEKRFDGLKGELQTLEKRVERQSLIDDADRRAQGVRITGDPKIDREMRGFSLTRMIRHHLTGGGVDAGREIEISAELARMEGRNSDGFFAPYSIFERRADVITTTQPGAGPGGNVIGTDHLGGQFIDILREANPLTHLGVRTLSGLVGNVDIPRLKQSTSVGWFGENTTIPQTDAKFDKVTLTPKHVGAWTEYSRNMLLQSSPDIESILRSDLAQVLGLEVARATINGTGTGAEPRGILNTAGIQTVAQPADAMQYAPMLADLLFTANVGNAAFLTNAGYKLTIDQLLTTDGLPIGAAAFFRGYPFAFSSLVPAPRCMIAGNYSEVLQGTWSSVEVLINPFAESAYKKGNILLRIILTMNVAIRHPEAFATFGA